MHASKVNQNGPLIISAGFFRTGTTSVCLALEELGVGKCYHPVLLGFAHSFKLMNEMSDSLIKFEENEISFDEINIDKYYKKLGCQVWYDVPFAPYWKEISDYYKNIKIILTIRDFDSWYKSALKSLDLVYPWYVKYMPYTKYTSGNNYLFFKYLLPRSYNQFGGVDYIRDINNKEHVRKNYYQAIENIKKHCKENNKQLLVFNVKQDGWKPLCKFLNPDWKDEDIPKKPLPRANDAMSLESRVNQTKRELFGKWAIWGLTTFAVVKIIQKQKK